MSKENKIIMLSYYFPPVKAIGSIRNKNVADSFAKNGFELKVFTSDPKASDDRFDVEGICPYDLKYFVSYKNKSRASSLVGKKRKWATKLMNTYPFSILIGEGGVLYSLRILIKLLKYRKDKVIIYSSFRPIADHHIAFIFKVLFKKVIWVADFRDIIIDKDKLDVYLPRFQEWVYKRIMRRADILLTVSKGLANFFKEYNDNIQLLRNGAADNLKIENLHLLNSKKFNISYTGALYSGRRDPSLLFSAIRKIVELNPSLSSNIQLNYAGKEGVLWDNLISEYNLNEISNNLGLIKREQALSLQLESNINLLLSWSSPNNKGILTGKFYEYIAAGNSILCIINGEQDEEFENIFDEDQIGLLVYKEEDKLINWLKTELKNSNSITIETQAKFKWSNGFNNFIDSNRNIFEQ